MLFKNLKYLIVENNQEEDKLLLDKGKAVVETVKVDSFSTVFKNSKATAEQPSTGLIHITLDKVIINKSHNGVENQTVATKLSDEHVNQIKSTLNQLLTSAEVSDLEDHKYTLVSEPIVNQNQLNELKVFISFNIVKKPV